ncbi:MAG: ABC transporter ATP-binding protein/permease [Oscillospiraceae bacterium]|nr:ABC transporter ATP-binding protein/permease [Oscillospiraceae bacterium]
MNKEQNPTSDAVIKENNWDYNSKYDITFRNFGLVIENKKIIDSFTFTFETGKKYLIVGMNGSGKSTLFKALNRWYEATTGYILINDKNINDTVGSEICKSISYLNENVSLLSGTVRENITLFRTFNNEVIDKAVRLAQVKLDLEREILDEGFNISSGEQRRIEIARSLLDSAKVLIFDEVVSTLDIETAYEIEKLALSFQDQTVIFISHNFSGKLIEKYDEILVMDSGTLLDYGNYNALISSCSYFKRICDIKFGEK